MHHTAFHLALIFFGIAVGIVGAISFVTWELPSMDEVRNAGPVTTLAELLGRLSVARLRTGLAARPAG